MFLLSLVAGGAAGIESDGAWRGTSDPGDEGLPWGDAAAMLRGGELVGIPFEAKQERHKLAYAVQRVVDLTMMECPVSGRRGG